MKHNYIRVAALFTAIITIFANTGCKERTILGKNYNLSNSNIEVDTLNLHTLTKTYYDNDTLNPTSLTISGIPVFEALGTVNTDPYFGQTYSDIYFQVIPSSFGLTYAPYTIDSSVLILPWGYFTWGDSANVNNTQTYQVFRVTDPMSLDSNYYASTVMNVDATPLSQPTAINVHSLEDSVSVFGLNYGPHMRIRLDSSVFNSYIRDSYPADSDVVGFQQYLSGICVKCTHNITPQTYPSLPYFELDGTQDYSRAEIMVYAHTTALVVAGMPTDTVIVPYYFDMSTCAHFNHITRRYSGAIQKLFRSTAACDPIVALQNSPGAGIDVKIYNIKAIPQQVVINKAELDISRISSGNTTADEVLFPPIKLYALGDSDGVLYTVADRYPLTSTSPLDVLDGYLHPLSFGNLNTQTYTINLPRELQAAIAAGRDTIHLHINGTQDYYGAYRMVAGGGNYGVNTADSAYSLRMRVVYSKLK